MSGVRWVPDGLAGRFALLLAIALLTANAVAVALIATERGRHDRAAWRERQIERVVSLVPALEALDTTLRRAVGHDASSRFADVSVDTEPFATTHSSMSPGTAALTRRLESALPGRDVRVDTPAPGSAWRRLGHDDDATSGSRARSRPWSDGQGLVISIALRGAGSDTPSGATAAPGAGATGMTPPVDWLNIVSRSAGPPRGRVPEGLLLLVLGLSLLAVLGVGLCFVRRLTRPLDALAVAARAAGRGDRSVRLSESGPRELRDVATAFNDMQARIARFDAERTRLLAAVGHDLRTPITSLRIRAEMLEDAVRDPIVRSLDEMKVMADGLVAFARGERDVEERASLELAPLLERLVDERGVALVIETRPHVAGRPVALARAFGNLVDNALRYAGGARVRIATGTDEAGVASAIVDVEDDGPGIPVERLETVLEPFVRGEGSRSQDTGGAGLGLSIARTVIRAHGGDLQLANRDPSGLRARVTLPLETEGRAR